MNATKNNLRGDVVQKCYRMICRLSMTFSTLWCRVKMMVWGIEFGKKCIFGGNTLFYKSPESIIAIGNDCKFYSNSRFNFRGIDHRCILQTNPGGKIVIGDRCGFSGVSIVSSVSVEIGDDVMCGSNVIIGDRNDHEDIYPDWQPQSVKIGNRVWIGMNVTIMRGVSIGDGSIVGAGSIVTKDIPSGVIAAGNPCRVIQTR